MPEGEQGMNVARTIGYLGGLPLESSARQPLIDFALAAFMQ